jgi:hypothetical protein
LRRGRVYCGHCRLAQRAAKLSAVTLSFACFAVLMATVSIFAAGHLVIGWLMTAATVVIVAVTLDVWRRLNEATRRGHE